MREREEREREREKKKKCSVFVKKLLASAPEKHREFFFQAGAARATGWRQKQLNVVAPGREPALARVVLGDSKRRGLERGFCEGADPAAGGLRQFGSTPSFAVVFPRPGFIPSGNLWADRSRTTKNSRSGRAR